MANRMLNDSGTFRDAESFAFFKLHHYLKQPPPWGELGSMTQLENLRFTFGNDGFCMTSPDGTPRVNKPKTVTSAGPNALLAGFEVNGKDVLVKIVRLNAGRIHVAEQADGKDVMDGSSDMIRMETTATLKK
jgi:hypothetical protein